jgi:hypothetical protein
LKYGIASAAVAGAVPVTVILVHPPVVLLTTVPVLEEMYDPPEVYQSIHAPTSATLVPART